ncbi:hypothetical protein DL764_007759 [Monosporascus ibericus]|uniref:Peptidase S54 rhomboid domain-containing protein n=1 Tax=Monosporascus ibericus TaxID=155417 RepID=A0A4Q4T1F2_9PEZI|nr:hypothetical protein DL764_007759 [Monosporascus ibericus]
MLHYALSSPPRRPFRRAPRPDRSGAFIREYRGLRRWLYACFIGGNILVTGLWVAAEAELQGAKKRAELESGALHQPEAFLGAVRSGTINAPLAKWMIDHASLSREIIRARRRYTLLTHSISSGLVASHLVPFFIFCRAAFLGGMYPVLILATCGGSAALGGFVDLNFGGSGRNNDIAGTGTIVTGLAAAATTVNPRMRFFVGFSQVGIQLWHLAALLLYTTMVLYPNFLSWKNRTEEHDAKALAAHLQAVEKRADEIRASGAPDAVSGVEGEAVGTAETLGQIGAARVEEGWQDCAGPTHKNGDEAQKTGRGNADKLVAVKNGQVLRLAQQSPYAHLASAAFGIFMGIFWRCRPF